MTTHFRILKRLFNPAQEIDWADVYAEQLPRVYNYFRYRFCDDALAEDLTQTVFEKAWRARSSYRSDLAAFSTWTFRIARNTAADYLRRRTEEVPLDEKLEQGGDSVEDTVQLRGDVHRLEKLLKTLPDREREILALKYGAGMKNRLIAQQTGLSESNVGTILNRVVVRLREAWENDL